MECALAQKVMMIEKRQFLTIFNRFNAVAIRPAIFSIT